MFPSIGTPTLDVIAPAKSGSQSSIQSSGLPDFNSGNGQSGLFAVESETADALSPVDPTGKSNRLRDREGILQRQSTDEARDAIAGPPPAFEVSLLEQQKSLAFDSGSSTDQTQRNATSSFEAALEIQNTIDDRQIDITI